MTVHESTRRHPGTAGAVPEAAPASGAAVDSALVDGALVDGVLTEGVPVDPGVPVDTTSLPVLPTNGATGPDATSPDRGRLGRGILLSLLSPISNQVGAGIGALAFPAIGPVGVVSVRQLVMALLMVPLGRPRFRRFTRSDWALVVALGLALATMNITLYYSVSGSASASPSRSNSWARSVSRSPPRAASSTSPAGCSRAWAWSYSCIPAPRWICWGSAPGSSQR